MIKEFIISSVKCQKNNLKSADKVHNVIFFPSLSGVSSAFVSRTGKTTDVTQIKGWREKFTLSEAVLTPESCKPEGAL